MATWGYFWHIAPPIPSHPHPLVNSISVGLNQFIVGAIAGLGMFSEAYFLFAIGSIKDLWAVLYPTCFGTPSNGGKTSCSEQVVVASTYVEVCGLIIGMNLFGIIAKRLGRRWSSRATSTLMFLGGAILVAANGNTLNGQFIMFNVGLAIFGVATGGEYPTAASSAAERAEQEETKSSEHRGRLMVFTFAMQGWGNFVNTAVICFLLAVTANISCPVSETAGVNNNNNTSTSLDFLCNSQGLEITWRLQYALGLIVIIGMMVYRWCYLKESEIWKQREQQIKEENEEQLEKEKKAIQNFRTSKAYGTRLFGVCICWYLNDIAFYGTKLFQGTIVSATLGPNRTLLSVMLYTLLYSGVSLVGYYMSALTVDRLGRVRIQAFGFFVVGIIYLVCGFHYDTLSTPGGIVAFQVLFFISGFFIQFGPNSTTWLLPGELFPTDIRTQAHGMAASSGQAGSLTASLLFSLGNGGQPVGAQFIFYFAGFATIVGFIMTVIFVPDTTHLTLTEVDKRWEQETDGQDYQGPAKCWENLSFFEAWLYNVSPKDSIKNLPQQTNHRRSDGEVVASIENTEFQSSDKNDPQLDIA